MPTLEELQIRSKHLRARSNEWHEAAAADQDHGAMMRQLAATALAENRAIVRAVLEQVARFRLTA